MIKEQLCAIHFCNYFSWWSFSTQAKVHMAKTLAIGEFLPFEIPLVMFICIHSIQMSKIIAVSTFARVEETLLS